MNKKKYNIGGVLSTVSNAALPGSGMFVNLFLDALKTRGANSLQTTPMTQNTNPYGMKFGGEPSGYKQYNAPSHEMGGQPIDGSGNVTGSGSSEIEGTENKYTYNMDGSTYVFSDANGTSQQVRDILAKYKDKSTDEDLATKSAMEMEIKKVEKLNEAMNTAREAVNNVMQARYGKKLQLGGNPDLPTDDTVLNTDNQFELGLPVLPSNTFTPMTSVPSVDDKLSPLPTINGNIPTDMGFGDTKARLDQAYASGNNQSNNILGNIDFPGILRAAGIVASGIDAFQRPDVEDTILPDYSKADDRFNRMNADLTQARQDAVGASNRMSELNRNSASSYSQYRARETSNIGNLQDALGRIGTNEQQLRNQVSQVQGQYETNKALTDARIKDDVQQRNLANKARVQDLRKLFMSDIVSEADRLSTAKDIKNISKAKIKEGMTILKQLAPDFSINENFVTNLIKVSKGELDVSKLSNEELILFNKLNNK